MTDNIYAATPGPNDDGQWVLIYGNEAESVVVGFMDEFHAKNIADLAAAPKPDCVGVEELKKNVRDADQPDGWNGSYVHPYDIGWNDCVDYLADRGLLAVKEKPND